MATKDPTLTPPKKRAVIGRREECVHPVKQQEYLGHMGGASLHQCAECEAVVIAW